MKSKLEKIAYGVAALVAIALAVIAVQPSAFSIERSVVIAAPAERIHPHIASVRAMDAWSPWTKLDPKLQVTYSGPESGVGAQSDWSGPDMGRGRVTVTAVRPPSEVEMRLEMFEPMAASNRVLFTLVPDANGTEVTWRMEGENGFVSKAFSLIADMDAMVGGEFAKGLAALRTLVEAEARAHAAR